MSTKLEVIQPLEIEDDVLNDRVKVALIDKSWSYLLEMMEKDDIPPQAKIHIALTIAKATIPKDINFKKQDTLSDFLGNAVVKQEEKVQKELKEAVKGEKDKKFKRDLPEVIDIKEESF
jgi:hypothetical protein